MKSLVRVLLLGLAGLAAIAFGRRPGGAPDAPTPPRRARRPPPPSPAGDIEDFVPSEKVSADDAVAFPVDI